jgi:hypothetical protein
MGDGEVAGSAIEVPLLVNSRQSSEIVANLVPYLPAGEEYRIVFMLRPLEEVIASQRAILDRLGRRRAVLGGNRLARVYAGQLVRLSRWMSSRPEIQVLTVDYAGRLSDPGTAVVRLAAFLGEQFDERAIEPVLRRQVAPAFSVPRTERRIRILK